MTTAIDPVALLRSAVEDCQTCRPGCRDEAYRPVPCSTPFGATEPPPVLVVGRNPGRDEDAAGAPFVGAAGRKLTEFLEAAGIMREHEVVVTNLVKCYTERNRPPTNSEVAACRRYLVAEIRLFRPKIVLGFGAQVAEALTHRKLSEVSGRPIESPGKAALFVTIHPAATLYNPSNNNRFWNDAEALRRWVEANLRAG